MEYTIFKWLTAEGCMERWLAVFGGGLRSAVDDSRLNQSARNAVRQYAVPTWFEITSNFQKKCSAFNNNLKLTEKQ